MMAVTPRIPQEQLDIDTDYDFSGELLLVVLKNANEPQVEAHKDFISSRFVEQSGLLETPAPGEDVWYEYILVFPLQN